MAITQTDILNNALTKVGASPIISISDQTNNARVLSRVYDIDLRSILAETKWNFATTRVALTSVPNTLAFSDESEVYVYAKPTDVIRIWDVSPARAKYREEGDYIISDQTDLAMRYVYFNDTPSKFPAYFLDAFTDKLCSSIAYSIVNSSSLGAAFLEKYEKISLPKAVAVNAQTGIQFQIVSDAWELAKYQDINQDA